MFLSFPAGTKMFQFPAFALANASDWSSTRRVSPFGNLRINSCLQIPGAYRSLPRPSSLSEAKASTVRSYSLSRTFIVNQCLEIALATCLFASFEIAVPFRNSKKLEF